MSAAIGYRRGNSCVVRSHCLAARIEDGFRAEAGDEKSSGNVDFYFETAEPTDAEREAIAYIDHVLQVEDIGLVESVQRGMRTPAFDSGRYAVDPDLDHGRGSGLSEHAVHHFHGLLIEAYQFGVDHPA